MPDLFLSNWSDFGFVNQEPDYIDYDALLASDDEFLCLESLIVDAEDFINEY